METSWLTDVAKVVSAGLDTDCIVCDVLHSFAQLYIKPRYPPDLTLEQVAMDMYHVLESWDVPLLENTRKTWPDVVDVCGIVFVFVKTLVLDAAAVSGEVYLNQFQDFESNYVEFKSPSQLANAEDPLVAARDLADVYPETTRQNIEPAKLVWLWVHLTKQGKTATRDTYRPLREKAKFTPAHDFDDEPVLTILQSMPALMETALLATTATLETKRPTSTKMAKSTNHTKATSVKKNGKRSNNGQSLQDPTLQTLQRMVHGPFIGQLPLTPETKAAPKKTTGVRNAKNGKNAVVDLHDDPIFQTLQRLATAKTVDSALDSTAATSAHFGKTLYAFEHKNGSLNDRDNGSLDDRGQTGVNVTSYLRPVATRFWRTKGQPWAVIKDTIVSDAVLNPTNKAWALLQEFIYYTMRGQLNMPVGHVYLMQVAPGQKQMQQGQDTEGKAVWLLEGFRYMAYPINGGPNPNRTPERIKSLFSQIEAQFKEAVFNETDQKADCLPIVFVNPTYTAMGLSDYQAMESERLTMTEHLRKVIETVLADFLRNLGELNKGDESKVFDQMLEKVKESKKLLPDQLIDYAADIVAEMARFVVTKSTLMRDVTEDITEDVFMLPPRTERKASEPPSKPKTAVKEPEKAAKPKLAKEPEKAAKPKAPTQAATPAKVDKPKAEKTEKKKPQIDKSTILCFMCFQVMKNCNCKGTPFARPDVSFTRSFQD